MPNRAAIRVLWPVGEDEAWRLSVFEWEIILNIIKVSIYCFYSQVWVFRIGEVGYKTLQLCFAQLNSRASGYLTGHIAQEGVHAAHRKAEKKKQKKKTFRLHIGHVRTVQSAVSIALSQAVQVTTSEHADLPLKHILQLFKTVRITCSMTIKRVLCICFIDVVFWSLKSTK